MKIVRFYTLNILVLFLLCTATLSGQTIPTSGFQASISNGCVPLQVSFSNHSTNAVQYLWDFGNGSTSSVANPSVVYSNSGQYDVKLIVHNAAGNSDTLIVRNAVKVYDQPIADFSYSQSSGCIQSHQVNFTNLSSGSQTYVWDFGDGNSSTATNPVHTYSAPGNYTVKLIASNGTNCNAIKQISQPISIISGPSVDFSANKTLSCDPTELFQFNGIGQSIRSWFWDFGDGDTSLLQHPSHVFNDTGKYTIRLITTSIGGCIDTLTKAHFISIYPEIQADFSPSLTSGCKPLSVDFNTSSAYQNISFSWDLGNGQQATGDSITNIFNHQGSYSITLYASNVYGCIDTIKKSDIITVKGISEASFNWDTLSTCKNTLIQFNNTSVNALNSSWGFGDGNFSTDTNPVHSFATSGNYAISLVTTDSSGCSSTSSEIITIQAPEADFSSSSTSNCVPFKVDFQDMSTSAVQWTWNFGDGTTSNLQHPKHTYLTNGIYDVSLTIETSNGCKDSIEYKNLIQVQDDTLQGNLNDTITGCLPLPVDLSQNTMGSRSWVWDFGNGDTSFAQNPTYVYNDPGVYTITLKSYSANGCPFFVKNYATVVIDSIEPKLSANHFDCQNGLVQLTDSTENISSWFWDFDDGTYSTLQSPTHQFPDTSVYNITLTLTTDAGCVHSVFFPNYIDFRNCMIAGSPAPPASGSPPSPDPADSLSNLINYAKNCAPQLVQFSNHVANATAWNWDFGNGASSTLENPLYVYNHPGVYDVQLIAQTASGPDTSLWKNHVTVYGPKAEFSIKESYECDSVLVQFNDSSQGAIHQVWKLGGQIDSSVSSTFCRFPYSEESHFVQLMIKDSMGCSSSLVKILSFPKRNILFTTPDTVCSNDSILFEASDPTLSYTWDFGDGNQSSSFNPYHVYAQIGTYALKVTTIDSIGCSEVYFLDSVHVKSVDAKFSILDTAGCINNFFAFVPNEINADSYYWNIGTHRFATEKYPRKKLMIAGNYDIKLNIAKDGCTNSYTHPTTVNVKDIAVDFSILQTGSCFPVQIDVQDTSSQSVQWEWAMNGNWVNGNDHGTFFVNDTALNLGLKVTAANGCVDSTFKSYAPLVLNTDFTVSDTMGCAPFPVSFNNLSSNAVQSTWYFGDGNTSTADNPTHIYTNAGRYTVALVTESADGCLDTLSYSNIIRVSSVEANYSSSFTSSCAPMLVNFTNASTSASSWEWNFGDGTSSTVKDPIYIFNNAGSFDVSLIVSNDDGCSDTLLNKEHILVPGPVTKFSISDTQICSIAPIQFIDSSTTATEWNWYFGDGNTSNQQHPTHTYSKGEYWVTLSTTDAVGCTGFYTYPSPVKMDVQPEAKFSIGDSSGCSPFTLNLTNESFNAKKWTWNLGEGIKSDDSLSNYTYLKAGDYAISLFVENEAGCTDSSEVAHVTVHPTYNAEIQPVTPVCENENSFMLTAQNTGGVWTGTGIKDGIKGIYSPELAGSGVDTVIYSFQGACPSSDTTQIIVKEAPRANFIVDQTEACNKLEATFKMTSPINISQETTNHSLTWKYNNVVFGSTPTVKKTFQPGLYDISLMVKAPNNCTDEKSISSLIKVYDSIPSIINIKRVSVLPSNSIFIEWEENTDYAFDYYALYKKSAGSYQLVDTFNDRKTTSFIDNTIQEGSNCYKIVSVDKCGQEVKLANAVEHCTINVNTKKVSDNEIKVSWSGYIGCQVDQYEILRFSNDLGFEEVIAQLDPQSTEFIDTTAFCNSEYSYRIKAKGSVGLKEGSWSDTSKSKVKGIAHLQETSIVRVSVKDNEAVFIEWSPVQIAPEFANGYIIHKSTDNKNFTPLTFIPKGITNFTDETSEVQHQNYSYKIEVVNTCQNESQLTNSASSILLKSNLINDESGQLKWTPYEGWKEGVKTYEIQRLNELNEWETIQKVLPNNNQLIVTF